MYWVGYNDGQSIFSDTFIQECKTSTIEFYEDTDAQEVNLIITTITEDDLCSETYTRYFRKSLDSTDDGGK